MVRTLLDVVQSYLDRTDGFYVQDINEVDEALQVASIAEEVFYDMYTYIRNDEFSSDLLTLEGLADVTKPNYLKLPTNVKRIHDSEVYYNVGGLSTTLDYKPMTYVTQKEFLERNRKITSENTNFIIVEDFNGSKFSVQDNKDPEYFTSFDGNHLVFDSYNKNKENTLHEANTQFFGSSMPVFVKESSFVIPLPDNLLPLYKDLVLVECYEALRQEQAPPMVQKRARTGLIKLQQETRRVGSAGRKGRNYARS